MKTIIAVILWCMLLVMCWPLALLMIVFLPLLLLILLPFKILGLTIEVIFKFIGAVVMFPFRLVRSI